MSYIMFFVSVLVSYLIGSFPTSFLLTKAVKGIDIRSAGSGNAGATNVLRVVGAAPAVATLIIDIAKGVLAVTAVTDFFAVFSPTVDITFYRPLLGCAAVAGHIWPVFLKFHGGKGVATTLGVGIVLAPGVFLVSLVIWLAVFFLSHYVSLASIGALAAFPLVAAATNAPLYTTIFSAIICFIVIAKHRTNVVRLLRKEEHTTILFKKQPIKAPEAESGEGEKVNIQKS